MNEQAITHSPWYKEFWVWFILGILGFAVFLGLGLLYFAANNPPGLISDDYYDVGKGINQSLERESYARRLSLNGALVIDNERGIATLNLQGNSRPQQLVLNLESPTLPEHDRRVILQLQPDGSYQGNMLDSVSGRRFIEVLGSEGDKEWRLFEEEHIVVGQPLHIGDE